MTGREKKLLDELSPRTYVWPSRCDMTLYNLKKFTCYHYILLNKKII